MDTLHENLPERHFVLYEDDRPVAIVDDALKEETDVSVWNPEEEPRVTGEPTGTPTPSPEPTPPTGWIEYDDEWWDAQMGESSGGYDDFYE